MRVPFMHAQHGDLLLSLRDAAETAGGVSSFSSGIGDFCRELENEETPQAIERQ
jgi:hypothetical protein